MEPLATIASALRLLGAARDLSQRRRKVRLTVHRAYHQPGIAMDWGAGVVALPDEEHYFVTVTNASHDRAIEVTHVWFATEPSVPIVDAALPKRLEYDSRWGTSIPVAKVPGNPDDVVWLARCSVLPDDKVIRSRPRRNVPPIGTVPR